MYAAATVLLAGAATYAAGAGALGTDDFAVVGYLPEWRYLQWTPDEKLWRWGALCEQLTHLIIFSIEVGPKGTFEAMDRFPDPQQMETARTEAAAHGTELLICFGGNSRTNGFPQMVASLATRTKFIGTLVAFCREHGLHGVDYNWEYPANQKEWDGLFTLLKETRAAFDASEGGRLTITLSYYPDKRQEALLSKSGALDAVDLMHMMSYDQPGRHSTWEFGKRSVDQGASVLPRKQITMGLPFYSRKTKTGQWDTYEDIAKKHAPKGGLDPTTDQIGDMYFNGAAMIKRKTQYAMEQGIGGVMIWEVGQDNFDNGARALDPATSLLHAISQAVDEEKRLRFHLGDDHREGRHAPDEL